MAGERERERGRDRGQGPRGARQRVRRQACPHQPRGEGGEGRPALRLRRRWWSSATRRAGSGSATARRAKCRRRSARRPNAAKRSLIRVPLREGRTLHHDVRRPAWRRQGRTCVPAPARHRHHRRRSDARGVRDARHPGRGREVDRLLESLQHGSRHFRCAASTRIRRARLRRAATSRYPRCRHAVVGVADAEQSRRE